MSETERTLDESVLKTWIGKSQRSVDMIDVGQAQRMQSTLDRDPILSDGDALPPLWHWIYFLEPSRMSILGRDGHPKLGNFIPPVDLPRRMWAGGRFEFQAPVRLGENITKTSTIKDVSLKHGRTGALCFVTVRHELHDLDGDFRLAEEHDIVYREDPKPGATPPPPPNPPKDAQWSRTIRPSPVMLFRYSALTFNGHRIHYDRDYSRDIEGYKGLVFHGPLTATLLADLAIGQRTETALTGFSFRATAPLLDTVPFTIYGKSGENGNKETLKLWAETPEGGLAMEASAAFSN